MNDEVNFEEISLTDLMIDVEYKHMLEFHNLTKGAILIRALENYSLMTRKDLIRQLNLIYEQDKTIEFAILEEYKMGGLTEEIRELNKKYGVLIKKITSVAVEVYIPMYNSISLPRLQLDLGKYGIKIFYITNRNYQEIVPSAKKIEDKVGTRFNNIILMKRIIIEAIKRHASDVHFDSYKGDAEIVDINEDGSPIYGHPNVNRIRFRIKQDLEDCTDLGITFTEQSELIKSYIRDKSISNAADVDATGIATSAKNVLDNGKVDLRITAHKTYVGYKCVMRIINMDTVSLKIEELGFDEDTQKVLQRLSYLEKGLTLITGKARSGKNTTAYGMLNNIKERDKAILEYSSPIETLMQYPQIDFMGDWKALADLTKLIVKEDTDYIYINEVPDAGIAENLYGLINSSMYVLTTMHIDRLWDLPIKLYQFYGDKYIDIIYKLNGVVNQKMYTTQCQECSEEFTIETVEGDILTDLKKFNVRKHFITKGCDKCNDNERLQPLAEYLLLTVDIKRELVKCKSPTEMSLIMRDHLFRQGNNLEAKLKDRIEKGEFSYMTFSSVLES